MKNPLIILIVFLFGCQKEISFEQPKPAPELQARVLNSVFPTSVNLGPDVTLYREFATCICRQDVYLNTCGVSPEFEAPNKGYNFYQISGPNQATIDRSYSSPILYNLTYGTYQFVGHAWVQGYAACLDSMMNDNVYDTITVKVLRRKK